MGSVTVGAGAAAGVFERESDLLSESRSAMATQVHCMLLRLICALIYATTNVTARTSLTFAQEYMSCAHCQVV